MAINASKSAIDSDFPDTERNREVEERAKRLREAVKAAGGNQAVANRASMPVGTLNRYLVGRDMKASAMVELARACDVPVAWLATGDGAPRGAAVPAPPQPNPEPSSLFNTLDIDRMARAIEMIAGMLAQREQRPTPRFLAQTILLAYDDLTRADQERLNERQAVKPAEEKHEDH